jgi:hypothetical protein
VARSRDDYCSLMYNLARNSEQVTGETMSSAAAARQKLLATLDSHPVWNVDAQANSFRVTPQHAAFCSPRAALCIACVIATHRLLRLHSRCFMKQGWRHEAATWLQQALHRPVERSLMGDDAAIRVAEHCFYISEAVGAPNNFWGLQDANE